MVPEIRLALIKEKDAEPVPILGPGSLEPLIEPLKHFSEEYFVAFHLDIKNAVTAYHVVSHGTTSASLVHPREVYKAAILSNASAIIVAHNHPTGHLDPSREDIETTEILINAAEVLGVKLLDHLIVSSKGFVSLREIRPKLWKE